MASVTSDTSPLLRAGGGGVSRRGPAVSAVCERAARVLLHLEQLGHFAAALTEARRSRPIKRFYFPHQRFSVRTKVTEQFCVDSQSERNRVEKRYCFHAARPPPRS